MILESMKSASAPYQTVKVNGCFDGMVVTETFDEVGILEKYCVSVNNPLITKKMLCIDPLSESRVNAMMQIRRSI